MEAMRESWTDQRLDKFAADTNRRFDEIDKRFDKVDSRLDRVDSRLDEVDRRFDMMEGCMKEGFARVDADIRELRVQTAAFQRTALQLGVGTMATFIVGFVGIIVTQL
jgi:uncharacterized iron-regulated protein